MKISYNAPVTLTFALSAAVVLVLGQFLFHNLIPGFFMIPGRTFDPSNILDYLRLFSYTLGHNGWDHYMSNFAFFLLLGPILEEKHGSRNLFVMIVITAVITGLLHILLFASSMRTGLMGASGIVFMMLILVSFTNVQKGSIPLTFILVVVLFLAKEIIQIVTQTDQISQFAHILGGVLGSFFGFMKPKKS